MRIAILGPIYTKKYFGGVATFDENLAIAYKNLDNEVVLYSKQLTSETRNKYGIIERPINLRKAFKQTAFDLIIVSLDYAIYLPLFKARKKVYFLHGFFSLSAYSPVKTIFAVAYQKFFLRYANYIISNSQFTCFINQEIYDIKSNGSVRLGVSYDYIHQLNSNECQPKEPNSLLFTGRLIESKKIKTLIEAMRVLKQISNQSFTLRVVGDGELKSQLINYTKDNKLNVKFYDRVSQSDIVKFYQNSSIFISLNPAEPFGITFCEALLAGCKIICPQTGGQNEFLSEYPDMVKILSNLEPITIARVIVALSMTKKNNQVTVQRFFYENTAAAILKIVGE
jgi:glycosyltransferase involved in cell wall biosynthesis